MRTTLTRIISRRGALAAALLAGCVCALAAQEGSPLARMMELNRNGRWDEAAQLARSFLDAKGAKPPAERCEAYWHLAYAQNRLGRADEARATLASYERDCKGVAPGDWVHAEVERLRKELAAGSSSQATPQTVARDDGFWRRASPASLGMNVGALNAHRDLCVCTAADACLVVHKGKIVQEIYSRNYSAPMLAMSSTKSVAGLLVGMLIDDGKIKSVDEPVCAYVAEWCEGGKDKVTLRHLLTMTAGLPDTRGDATGVGRVGDKNLYVAGLSLAYEPGAKWAYSNEGVQLLSPVMDKAAGEPIQDYARKRLFEPLGMRDTRLKHDDQKHAWTYADMETTPRDFARLGLLMLNKGVWRGRRILSESWVEQSTRPSQRLEPKYGLLWWLFDKPKGYAALGYLATNLYVFPGEELVVVRMQSKPVKISSSYEDEAPALFEQFVKRQPRRGGASP